MTGDFLIKVGDCLTVFSRLPNNSIDAIATDPPYELGFMGKRWDTTGVAFNAAVWQQCLRVLKPGGHLVAFGGTRTYHRLACAVEDEQFNAEVSNGLAVILCHIACEIAVQRALRNAFIRRGIEDMERAVTKLMNGYNLGNDRYRKLYTATTGDDIAQQSFWQAFKSSAERRNDMTHDGTRASDDEATESFEAAKAFVNHVTTFSRRQTVALRAQQAP